MKPVATKKFFVLLRSVSFRLSVEYSFDSKNRVMLDKLNETNAFCCYVNLAV